MKPTLLLLAATLLAWPQESEEARRAIEIVKSVNGKLGFDEKAPGRPVISLNL